MRFWTVFLLLAFSPLPALADTCLAEIQALFDGPLDSRKRPPHRVERTVTNGAGNVLIWDDVHDTPLRGTTGVRGQGNFTLVIDRNYWTGPTESGPWTAQADQLPAGRLDSISAQIAAYKAGVKEPECSGPIEDANGRTLLAYRFLIETAPDPTQNNGITRERNIWYIDPATNLPVGWEFWEMTNPWWPVDKGDREVALITYDPTISLTAP